MTKNVVIDEQDYYALRELKFELKLDFLKDVLHALLMEHKESKDQKP